jgi:hypothetical protein
MIPRRGFFSRMFGAAATLTAISVAEVKASVPEAEVHKLDRESQYLLVTPGHLTAAQIEKLQIAWAKAYADGIAPRVIVLEEGAIAKLYKLERS